MEVYCLECGLDLWIGELEVPKALLPILEKLDRKERMLFILDKIGSGEIDATEPEELIDAVICYHENDEEFMERVRPVILAYKIKH